MLTPLIWFQPFVSAAISCAVRSTIVSHFHPPLVSTSCFSGSASQPLSTIAMHCQPTANIVNNVNIVNIVNIINIANIVNHCLLFSPSCCLNLPFLWHCLSSTSPVPLQCTLSGASPVQCFTLIEIITANEKVLFSGSTKTDWWCSGVSTYYCKSVIPVVVVFSCDKTYCWVDCLVRCSCM